MAFVLVDGAVEGHVIVEKFAMILKSNSNPFSAARNKELMPTGMRSKDRGSPIITTQQSFSFMQNKKPASLLDDISCDHLIIR